MAWNDERRSGVADGIDPTSSDPLARFLRAHIAHYITAEAPEVWTGYKPVLRFNGEGVEIDDAVAGGTWRKVTEAGVEMVAGQLTAPNSLHKKKQQGRWKLYWFHRPSPLNCKRLALNELEAASCLLSAVLLAFLHSRIAGEESTGAEFSSKLFVDLKESSSDAQLDRTRLTGDAATLAVRLDVVSTFHSEVNERSLDEDLENGATKVFLEVSSVNGDLAFAWLKPDTSDRALAAASSVKLVCLCHALVLLDIKRLGVLCRVRMLFAGINL
jgi:hypothetical protein